MALNLCQFANIHNNKLGFLIGSGPSLRHIDSSMLDPYVTMSVNSSIVFKKDCDYFVSDDWSVANWSYFIRDLASSSCIKFLYNKKFNGNYCHLKKYEVCLFDHTWYFDPQKNKYNMNGLILNKDCKEPIIGARTSLASGLHLLHIMGCNPIVLLGCDGHMEGDKRYFWEYQGKWNKPVRLDRKTPIPLNVHMQIGKKECNDIKEYWTLFSKMNEKLDIKIINASHGSSIKVFEDMNIDKVIELYGDRKK